MSEAPATPRPDKVHQYRKRPFVALLDFDGLLCDMEPFAYELADRGSPGRWRRFFSHTREAAPIASGMELVQALDRLGWQCAVSSTRPSWSGMAIAQWLRDNMPPPLPRWTYIWRSGAASAAECKREHYVEAVLMSSRRGMCGLYVDDEQPVVDELVDLDVPAMHIDDLAGMSDAELGELLEYSVKNIDRRRREVWAAMRESGAELNVAEQQRARRRAKVILGLESPHHRGRSSDGSAPAGEDGGPPACL
jgi:hypothetical protein